MALLRRDPNKDNSDYPRVTATEAAALVEQGHRADLVAALVAPRERRRFGRRGVR